LKVVKDNIDTTYDSEEEFFADYRNSPDYAYYHKYIGNCSLVVEFIANETKVSVRYTNRIDIELLLNEFDSDIEHAISIDKKDGIVKNRIFIGHGRNPQWRELKDHLVDKHNLNVIAYEVGSRAGHSIRDILDEMMNNSSIAFLVMTGEDIDEKGNLHARENVIHEIGLFQGKLGFSKAIILLENETNEFSNIHGIEQIRFNIGNIKETFGEVLAVINRESSHA